MALDIFRKRPKTGTLKYYHEYAEEMFGKESEATKWLEEKAETHGWDFAVTLSKEEVFHRLCGIDIGDMDGKFL